MCSFGLGSFWLRSLVLSLESLGKFHPARTPESLPRYRGCFLLSWLMADDNQRVFKCRDPERGNPRCGKPRSDAALEATIADAVEVYSTNLVLSPMFNW